MKTITVTVGVSYRTDGNGKKHLEYDCKAISSLNALKDDLKKMFGPDVVVEVKVKSLPTVALNQKEIERSLSPADILKDLEGVDLLYIPGSPSALDDQAGSSLEEKLCREEENFNKTDPNAKKAKDKRMRKEYENRSQYEHKLIDIARTRGMSILAVCAGSWRLLEGYGGGVRTLATTERSYHYNSDNLWSVKHPVHI